MNYEIEEKFGIFQCDLCTEMFSSETNLTSHQELHDYISFLKPIPTYYTQIKIAGRSLAQEQM